jgi:hypothetical protein
VGKKETFPCPHTRNESTGSKTYGKNSWLIWERMNFLKLIEYSPKPIADFILSSETLKYSFPGLGVHFNGRALPSMCTALVQLPALQKKLSH